MTGQQSPYISTAEKLYAAWGFDDYASGIKAIRATITPFPRPPPIAEMPIELPTDPTEREGFLPDLGQMGLSLPQGSVQYVHSCGVDFVDNMVCASTTVTVDTTPPLCQPPVDIRAGRPASNFSFSDKSGYTGRWSCRDDESGLMFVRYMAYVDVGAGAPTLVQKSRTRSGTNTGVFTIPVRELQHGARYFSCIVVRNGAGLLTEGDLCSKGVVFDATAPTRTSGRVVDHRGALHVSTATSQDLCATFGRFTEDYSALSHIVWDLVQMASSQAETVVSSIELSPETSVGDWNTAMDGGEVCRTLAGPLQHGGRYFSRVKVYNTAIPPRKLVTQGDGFGVDDTPPVGLSGPSIRQIYPADVAAQALSGRLERLSIKVAVSGTFHDLESGVEWYKVSLHHASMGELANATVTGRLVYFHTFDPINQALDVGTTLVVQLSAINRAGMESETVATTIEVSSGMISLPEPFVSDSAGYPLSSPLIVSDYSFMVAFDVASDPQGAEIVYEWTIGEGLCLAGVIYGTHYPQGAINTGAHASQHAALTAHRKAYVATKSLFTGSAEANSGSMLQLPSGYLVSTISDVGLDEGATYCGQVTACSVAIEGVPHRCVNMTTPTVTVDTTPPVASATMSQPSDIAEQDTLLTVEFSCVDAIAIPAEGLFGRLSLGTASTPSLYFDNIKLSLPSSVNDGTSFTTNGNVTMGSMALTFTESTTTTLKGTVSFDKTELAAVPDGMRLLVSLQCIDDAGHVSEHTPSLQPLRLNTAPPYVRKSLEGEPQLQVSDFSWSDTLDAWVGNPLLDGIIGKTAFHWGSLFGDASSETLTYHFCIGAEPDVCSVLEATSTDPRAEADLPGYLRGSPKPGKYTATQPSKSTSTFNERSWLLAE